MREQQISFDQNKLRRKAFDQLVLGEGIPMIHMSHLLRLSTKMTLFGNFMVIDGI